LVELRHVVGLKKIYEGLDTKDCVAMITSREQEEYLYYHRGRPMPGSIFKTRRLNK